jgi:hypothetical protein
MTKLFLVLSLFFGISAGAANLTSDLYAGQKSISKQDSQNHDYYTFFDWARGNNGWGYCYEFDNYGVLNNGRPVHPFNCEQVNPSYFNWARGWDGYVYCFQFTPYNAVMNDGHSVHPSYCHY